MKNRQNKAFTLIELLIAIFLFGMVVLTGITVELAMRRMQIKPEAQVKILDELIPAVERIRKDFQRQIGTLDNSSLEIKDYNRWLAIRVDSDNSANVTAGDEWRNYRWNGTVGDPLEYSNDNFTGSYERMTENIILFNVVATEENTALTVEIGARRHPGQGENISTNPSAYLSTTIFSRMISRERN